MSVVAIRADLYELRLAAISRECVIEGRRERGREKFVVFAVDPEHRRRRGSAKLTRSFSQQVGAKPLDPTAKPRLL